MNSAHQGHDHQGQPPRLEGGPEEPSAVGEGTGSGNERVRHVSTTTTEGTAGGGQAQPTGTEDAVELLDDVWGHVLSSMEDKDVWRLGAVCRAWREVVDRLRPKVKVKECCLFFGGLERMTQIRKVHFRSSSNNNIMSLVGLLGRVHTLDLSGCSMAMTDNREFSALGGVHTLNLSGCWMVRDVSALGGVHTLNLSNCENVRDVSALGGVHTLNLSNCERVTDVSALGGVHTLDLSGCHRVRDVSALGGVHTLNLSNCENVTDVSALGGVHTLNLSNCENVRDVSALGGVHTLDLSGCYRVTDRIAVRGVVHKLYGDTDSDVTTD